MRYHILAAFCLCAAGLSACVTPGQYFARHRTEGMRVPLNIPLDKAREVVAGTKFEVQWPADEQPEAMAQMLEGEDTFHLTVGWCECLVDLASAGTERTEAKVLCARAGGDTERGITDFKGRYEGQIASILTAAVAKARLERPAAPSPEPPPAAVASDVDQPKYRRDEDADRFAVVIGIEKYQNLPKAAFAGRDAQAVREHMLALGVPARNIFFAADQDATRSGILKAVHTWLPNRVGPNSTVYFYYSGHGAPDPETHEAYLLPIDGDPEALVDTAFSLKSLYHHLGALKAARVVVALDSCFSGSGGRSVLAGGVRPLVTKVDLPMTSGNIISLAAAQADQISGTMDEQGHGTFTYYLLKGLNGGAAAADGSVSVQGLYDYLKPKVADAARLHNRDQQPALAVGAGAAADLKLR